MIFVTVGTTSFDKLVEEVSTEKFHKAAREAGYSSIRIQFGRGTVKPSAPPKSGSLPSPLALQSYRFKPTLEEDTEAASLIICHAGAGSILEGLRKLKRMLVVVNDELMDNHQEELASALEGKGHLTYVSQPQQVAQQLKEVPMFRAPFRPYPPADLSPFYERVVDLTAVPARAENTNPH
uniref:UDP-N-acetylglucosamine transferase subunit ALG13 n=1 Tax=Chromera velia CCMP2878 TaxID=1169474 RepID=A0A0G4G0T5_9ALVE|mmetsp:Transcript_44328/g.87520  ORF Transcript_44328/g.87520 Transcript_44328/m.87520 type:complete len:180 (+) Transcript_44328:186-725(+)|eukprot:Cvel_19651.t1-p1 / transcript=Cvel_19651.t1 / gene=Cvel_19651 / organism=Chromera_velia_CCMP2878 / gene_product=UDP-N-acetylglucosamine transferase subunit ALG13, putative / transcript_product=UDP-N-acetylglucosamine transferase subunit ALG13, putative / location=Cvel_scaffold1712:34012-36753(+) / protein_length=179 / sequence_SO=supercontig / SO=protein_coding / is_pseudo=false